LLQTLGDVGIAGVDAVDRLELGNRRRPIAKLGGAYAALIVTLQRRIGRGGRGGGSGLGAGHKRGGLGDACGPGDGRLLRGGGGCAVDVERDGGGLGRKGALLTLPVEEQPAEGQEGDGEHGQDRQPHADTPRAARTVARCAIRRFAIPVIITVARAARHGAAAGTGRCRRGWRGTGGRQRGRGHPGRGENVLGRWGCHALSALVAEDARLGIIGKTVRAFHGRSSATVQRPPAAKTHGAAGVFRSGVWFRCIYPI
jgi:hypothetical protein